MSALIVLACLVGAWEAYADLGATSSFVLPAPHAIAAALWDNSGLLGANLLPTALEVGLGIALALALGFALAIAVHLSPVVRRVWRHGDGGSRRVHHGWLPGRAAGVT